MVKKVTIILAVLLLSLLLGSAIMAAPTALTLPWWTVDGGGSRSTGGNFALVGTAGQAEAGNQSSGGNFQVNGGFWNGGSASGGDSYKIYLPVAIDNS